MGILHSLNLIARDLTFGITATRSFRPKLGHSNERVYCKPIPRALKM